MFSRRRTKRRRRQSMSYWTPLHHRHHHQQRQAKQGRRRETSSRLLSSSGANQLALFINKQIGVSGRVKTLLSTLHKSSSRQARCLSSLMPAVRLPRTWITRSVKYLKQAATLPSCITPRLKLIRLLNLVDLMLLETPPSDSWLTCKRTWLTPWQRKVHRIERRGMSSGRTRH